MKVVYRGRADAVQVGSTVVERGAPVEVDAEIAEGLLASGDWSKHTPPKPVKGENAEEATK